MAKKERTQYSIEAFERVWKDVELAFPVVIKYEHGGMEAFAENGLRTFIHIGGKNISFSKSKWVSQYSANGEWAEENMLSSIAEYHLYIKRLLWFHTISSAEEFNEYYDSFNKANEELESLAFAHDFQAIQEFTVRKGKIIQKNEHEIPQQLQEQPKQEEDFPF